MCCGATGGLPLRLGRLTHAYPLRSAYHGTSQLDTQTLRRRYPGKWRFFEDLRRHIKGQDFMYFLTYFDIPAAHLLAHLIDRTDAAGVRAPYCLPLCRPPPPHPRRNQAPAGYQALLPGLRAAFAANFGPDAFLHDTGWYFPAVKADPERYLYRRPEVKEWLHRVRANSARKHTRTHTDNGGRGSGAGHHTFTHPP